MNNIIYEIFDTLNYSISGMEQADKMITDKIYHLVEPYKNSLTDNEMEELKNLLYSATFIAKRELFVVGFYFAVELLNMKRL